MAVIAETNTSNNSRTESLTVATPTNTDIVTTAAEFQTALNDGALDITIRGTLTRNQSDGWTVPRITGGRIIRGESDSLLVRGSTMTGRILRTPGGSGGSLTLIGVRIDGGWREEKVMRNSTDTNFFHEDLEFLRMENCVSCYSKREGFVTTRNQRTEIVGCTAYACPKDFNWGEGTRDVLIENCLIMHLGDDSLGAHLLANTGLVNASMIFRNNVIRDANGAKGHSGVAAGTWNGKTSQMLFEGNRFEACVLYGIRYHEDTLHNVNRPANVIVRGNTFHNCRVNNNLYSDQSIGIAVDFQFSNYPIDSTLRVENNTFIRDPNAQGATLQSQYTWAQSNHPDKPQNVPGVGANVGCYNRSGFDANETLRIATRATRFEASSGAGTYTHSGNTYQGSGWTNTIT